MEKLKKWCGEISRWVSASLGGLKKRWRKMSPGFRYAFIYFLCVVAITALVWWQFSPTNTLLFNPESKGPSANTEDELADPGEAGEETAPAYPSVIAFREGKEVMAAPMAGDVLLGSGEAFSASLSGVTAGIHIGGIQGDPVYAACRGKVSKVIEPGDYQEGIVWIDHGDFTTRYINLGFIFVKPGSIVSGAEKIGELGTKLRGDYVGDYLIFEVWNTAGDPLDPSSFFDPSSFLDNRR